MMIFMIYTLVFFIIELLYFKLADIYNIIDMPNERSSHTGITIRGAGVLFPIAFLIPLLYTNALCDYLPLAIGLLSISIISFMDDIMTLNNKVRIAIHFMAVALLMMQVNAFSGHWYLIPFSFIVTVGVINAYNFMDGINGITALYSLVAVITFYWIRNDFMNPLSEEVYISLIAAVVVFSFFNVRKRAKCFLGDVGSITMAFILSYLILNMIMQTGQGKWLLLLGVYGLDSVATIVLRIIRRENIFKAHRSHFYQYLVNDRRYGHVQVSFAYALLQLALNIVVIRFTTFEVLAVYILLILIYVAARLKLEGAYRLFKNYQLIK